MTLTSKQRQEFKAQAHSLNPVVMIGDKGLTENVLNEINIALEAHELIKIKIAGAEKTVREELAEHICQAQRCELVQMIGNIVIVYRKQTKKKK